VPPSHSFAVSSILLFNIKKVKNDRFQHGVLKSILTLFYNFINLMLMQYLNVAFIQGNESSNSRASDCIKWINERQINIIISSKICKIYAEYIITYLIYCCSSNITLKVQCTQKLFLKKTFCNIILAFLYYVLPFY